MCRLSLPRDCLPRSSLLSQRRHHSTNHWITKSSNFNSLQITRTPSTFRLAVKDNISTSTLPTTCASRILSNYIAPHPATIITQMIALGGQIVGTTNMDEFGMGSHSTHSAFGAVVNPMRDGYSAGGSSGGSAVAVRMGEADVALGTDTGGSVRLPAAYCGVVGVKPSYGMLSRYGVIPYANSLDTVGFFAPDVDPLYDLLFRGGLSETHDPQDPTSHTTSSRKTFAQTATHSSSLPSALPDPSQITIGIPLEYNITELDPLIHSTWLATADTLSSAGFNITPVSLPTTRSSLAAYYILAPAEASSNLAKYDGIRYGKRAPYNLFAPLYTETRGSLFGTEVQRRILVGAYSLSSAGMETYFRQAQKVRRLVQRDFDRVFKQANPLHVDPADTNSEGSYGGSEEYDLSDLDERIPMVDKKGPAQVDFIMTPTAPSLPPRLTEIEKMDPTKAYANDVFTVPASLAGLPAVSVPVRVRGDVKGREEEVDKFSIGVQVMGQFWDDARVLAMGKKIMEVMA